MYRRNKGEQKKWIQYNNYSHLFQHPANQPYAAAKTNAAFAIEHSGHDKGLDIPHKRDCLFDCNITGNDCCTQPLSTSTNQHEVSIIIVANRSLLTMVNPGWIGKGCVE